MDARKSSQDIPVCQDIEEEYKIKNILEKGTFG